MAPAKAPARRRTKLAPAVLVGRPQSLRGQLAIENPGSDDLFVSGPLLHSDVAPSPARASGSTVVPAGGTAQFAVSVALDPRTPAGEYTAHVEVGGERHEVVLQIVENVNLDITPDRVYVTPAGKSVRTTIVATNHGNVPVRLPAAATTSVDDAGTLSMRLGRAATTLQPGETTALTVDVTPPAGRDAAMRYDVPVSIGPRDITVVVLPTTDETKTPPTAGDRRPPL
ncbi:MAG: hypothetical protein ACJ735_12925 [Actinomycetes bacterium]